MCESAKAKLYDLLQELKEQLKAAVEIHERGGNGLDVSMWYVRDGLYRNPGFIAMSWLSSTYLDTHFLIHTAYPKCLT